MARIKRWFPVSHDINRDPDLWDLRAIHGEKILSVWLELLSIADRNDGDIPGSLESVITAVSWATRCRRTKVQLMFNSMLTKDWLRFDGCLKVTKYWKYHRTEERKPLPDRSLLTRPDLLRGENAEENQRIDRILNDPAKEESLAKPLKEVTNLKFGRK